MFAQEQLSKPLARVVALKRRLAGCAAPAKYPGAVHGWARWPPCQNLHRRVRYIECLPHEEKDIPLWDSLPHSIWRLLDIGGCQAPRVSLCIAPSCRLLPGTVLARTGGAHCKMCRRTRGTVAASGAMKPRRLCLRSMRAVSNSSVHDRSAAAALCAYAEQALQRLTHVHDLSSLLACDRLHTACMLCCCPCLCQCHSAGKACFAGP